MSEAEVVETPKAKRVRGPRAALTAGDIQKAFQLSRGSLDFIKSVMAEHPAEVQASALIALAKTNPELAAQLGHRVLPKDELAVDFRRGVFVHLADMGVEKGDTVKVSRSGNKVTLTIQK
jgi:hypothetical protein